MAFSSWALPRKWSHSRHLKAATVFYKCQLCWAHEVCIESTICRIWLNCGDLQRTSMLLSVLHILPTHFWSMPLAWLHHMDNTNHCKPKHNTSGTNSVNKAFALSWLLNVRNIKLLCLQTASFEKICTGGIIPMWVIIEVLFLHIYLRFPWEF